MTQKIRVHGLYQQKKDHFRTIQPGFYVGGPILKDRLQFFVGFEPPLSPHGVNFGQGAQLYQVLEGGYTPQQWINGGTGTYGTAAAVIPSSWYNKPYRYQTGRTVRFGARFNF